jgi:hypothetical protein
MAFVKVRVVEPLMTEPVLAVCVAVMVTDPNPPAGVATFAFIVAIVVSDDDHVVGAPVTSATVPSP